MIRPAALILQLIVIHQCHLHPQNLLGALAAAVWLAAVPVATDTSRLWRPVDGGLRRLSGDILRAFADARMCRAIFHPLHIVARLNR